MRVIILELLFICWLFVQQELTKSCGSQNRQDLDGIISSEISPLKKETVRVFFHKKWLKRLFWFDSL